MRLGQAYLLAAGENHATFSIVELLINLFYLFILRAHFSLSGKANHNKPVTASSNSSR